MLAYLFFIKEDLPNFIEFQDSLYGPRDFQKGNDSNSKMFRYNSESKTNTDYILLLKPNNNTEPSREFAELFSEHFSTQGFSFKKQGDRMLGLGNRGVIYIINLPDLDIVAMLIVETKTNKPKSISEAENIFTSLSEIKL